MSEREISLVLGTAGHIDHGKTTLVKAITGVDCDRLNEEKKRGITIELGFAPLRLDDGRVVSIVDVPGHERFIRQMVAGAAGVDAVLFVVAADEGVMPQTREHLAILELLGVKNGVVAMTKCDRVEHDFLALAQDDVRELMRGTFLENAPIVPVSAMSGENLDVLLSAIKKLVNDVRPRPRKGALFLPIDRTFAVSGFGTVITGTAYKGTVHPNDEVEILPSEGGKNGRVRSVQVHGKSVEEGWAGQRIAASISGVSLDELSRGDVVCAAGVYRTTRVFDASLHAISQIKHWQRVHLLIGTSEVLARVSLIGKKIAEAGTDCAAQIFVEEDIVCTFAQKFILRFYSPLSTIAGGTVLMPHAKRTRRAEHADRLHRLSVAQTLDERLEILLEEREVLSVAEAARLLQENISWRDGKEFLLSQKKFDELKNKIVEKIGYFHAERPTEKGIQIDELSRANFFTAAKFDSHFVRSLLSRMADEKIIMIDGQSVRLADFAPRDDAAENAKRAAVLDLCRARAFQPPTVEEFPQKILDGMKNSGDISIVSGFVLSREIEEKLLEILRGIDGEITLALVRDATASSRKYILPLLEYFDAKGITRRVGEIRIFRGKK